MKPGCCLPSSSHLWVLWSRNDPHSVGSNSLQKLREHCQEPEKPPELIGNQLISDIFESRMPLKRNEGEHGRRCSLELDCGREGWLLLLAGTLLCHFLKHCAQLACQSPGPERRRQYLSLHSSLNMAPTSRIWACQRCPALVSLLHMCLHCLCSWQRFVS